MEDGLIINASSGVVGAIIGAACTYFKSKKACTKCPEHADHESRLRKLEADNAANVAEIRADIKNMCRSIDELRADLKALRRE